MEWLKVGSGGCMPGAACQAIQGTGVCTYPAAGNAVVPQTSFAFNLPLRVNQPKMPPQCGGPAPPGPPSPPSPPPPGPPSPPPAPGGKFAVGLDTGSYPGMTKMSLADFKDPSFLAFFQSNSGLPDLKESMVGCCVFGLSDGYLTIGGTFYTAFNSQGARECAQSLSPPVKFGGAVGAGSYPGQYFGNMNASVIAMTTTAPSYKTLPGCETSTASWGLYKGGSGPTPPGPPPPSPGPPPPPTPPGPPPSGSHYGDPAKGPCLPDEKAVTINGISGSYCAPHCSASAPCPAVPAGTTAAPQCVVSDPSPPPSLCAVICVPSMEWLKVGSGGCMPGAACQAIQGTGVCTYPAANKAQIAQSPAVNLVFPAAARAEE